MTEKAKGPQWWDNCPQTPQDPEIVFKKEFKDIKNKDLKVFTVALLERADYKFWWRAASSTQKYHPPVCNQLGGVVIHTKRVFYFAKVLCTANKLSELDTDIVLAACLLHDIAKTGKGEGSYEDYENHPLNVRKLIPENWDEVLELFADSTYLETCRLIAQVFGCIELHMGQWTPVEARKPMSEYTTLEIITHEADLLAADKGIVLPTIDVQEEYAMFGTEVG